MGRNDEGGNYQSVINMTIMANKFNRSELILFFERLELYISSGLTLNKALMVAKEGVSRRQKETLEKIRLSIESGNLLSGALRKFLGLPATLSGLIENGEASGRLKEALNSSRALLEREDELRKKCFSAMAYPIIIGIFALILTIGLMRGIMPQIVPMLKSLHVPLPLLTRVVMAFSDNLSRYGIYIFFSGVIILTSLSYSYKKIKSIRKALQTFLIHTPLLGNIVYSYFFSVFLRSCGSLVESGLSSAAAYRDTANSLALFPLKNELLRESLSVSHGVPISQALRKIKKIPPFVSPLTSAGEYSGALGKSLLRSADIIDRDMEHSLKKITALIEPVMMAGMGCVVGAIALSIMMPIYNISKVLQH
jgi:type IV pilus assembly protein PilC